MGGYLGWRMGLLFPGEVTLDLRGVSGANVAPGWVECGPILLPPSVGFELVQLPDLVLV